MTIEQLTLNGAVTLLNYLQYAQQAEVSINASALSTVLREMLNQLETIQPGSVTDSNWQKSIHLPPESTEMRPYVAIDHDRPYNP